MHGRGETAGLAGVTVVLLDSDGDIVATTTTDANGNYTLRQPAGRARTRWT